VNYPFKAKLFADTNCVNTWLSLWMLHRATANVIVGLEISFHPRCSWIMDMNISYFAKRSLYYD